MVAEPSAGDCLGTPRAGQEAYLGSAGGPGGSMNGPPSEWCCGFRVASRASMMKVSIGRVKETVLGEIAQDRKEQAWGRAEGWTRPPELRSKVAAGLPVT